MNQNSRLKAAVLHSVGDRKGVVEPLDFPARPVYNTRKQLDKRGITMDYTIRRAAPGDEAALAHIQAESWKAGFCHILSAEILERYTQMDKLTAMYRRTLEHGMGNCYLLSVRGTPHCIACWDATREPDMPGYAELICIHSLQGKWRSGYGSRMMDAVLRDMAAAGYAKVMLWVFEGNHRARGFYEANGFSANGRTKDGFGSVEVCYEKML